MLVLLVRFRRCGDGGGGVWPSYAGMGVRYLKSIGCVGGAGETPVAVASWCLNPRFSSPDKMTNWAPRGLLCAMTLSGQIH